MLLRGLTLAALVCMGACGDDTGVSAVDAAANAIDAATSGDAIGGQDAAMLPLIGRIELSEFFTRAGARAEFFQEGFPAWQTETMSAGACRLLESMPAFCQQPCAGLCVANDTCAPLPTRLSAGDIVISGLATALTLEATGGGRYSTVPFPVPDELFSAGNAITANAAGEDIESFAVSATGVDDIVSNVPTGSITLADDADFVFTWTASGNASERVNLHIDVPAAAHGLPIAAIIECDVPDSAGTLTLPKELIAELPTMDGSEDACGNIDCGRRVLERYTEGGVSTASGRVQLRIAGRQPLFITHP